MREHEFGPKVGGPHDVSLFWRPYGDELSLAELDDIIGELDARITQIDDDLSAVFEGGGFISNDQLQTLVALKDSRAFAITSFAGSVGLQ